MEMDCELKKLAGVFKFFLRIVEKSVKTDYSLVVLGEIPSYFLHCVPTAISCYGKGFLSNI